MEGIRTGKIPDPTVTQVAALAAAFGVPPSYLLDRGKDPSLLDRELLRGPARRDDARDNPRVDAPTRAREADLPRDSEAVRGPARCPSPRRTERKIVHSDSFRRNPSLRAARTGASDAHARSCFKDLRLATELSLAE